MNSAFRGSELGRGGASGSSSLKSAIMAAPFVFVVSITFTLLLIMVPASAILGALVPLLLLLCTKAKRPLLAACLVGNLLMLFGSTGEVEFLGRVVISGETTVTAVLFSNSLAFSIFLTSNFSSRNSMSSRTVVIPSSTHIALLALASILLLARFTSGVPLFLGDSGRLSGLLSTNPYLGLFSGVVPIAAAFLVSKKSNLVLTLKIIVLILVIGTASRLLLGAVLVGFVSSSTLLKGGISAKTKAYLVVAGLATLLAVTKIYAARTAEGIQRIYESRISSIGGVTGWVSDLIGPSIFYAARNGLVIHEIISDNGLNPPNGFIAGGLLRVVNMNIDPEIWLTTAIGFNVDAVGAIATPIWAGAHADLGLFGACVLAVALGLIFSLLLRKVPELEYWFAFGILLSFYGSYIVSSQFIVASLLVIGISLAARRTQDRPMTSSEQKRLGG